MEEMSAVCDHSRAHFLWKEIFLKTKFMVLDLVQPLTLTYLIHSIRKQLNKHPDSTFLNIYSVTCTTKEQECDLV